MRGRTNKLIATSNLSGKFHMPHATPSIVRIVAVVAFVGGLAVAGPLGAAPSDASAEPMKNAVDHSPQGAALRVEDRIKTLHDKLAVTSAQEPKWSGVAQAMRDNESAISQLIQERQQNTKDMTAIEDLQSYEKVAQAHLDGLQKLIPAFQALYNDMSDAQRKEADEAFSRFEGHHGDLSNKKHG